MTPQRLTGMVALVTGAGSGIGKAAARRLSAEGAAVVLVDIVGPSIRDLSSSLPGASIAVEADVSSEADVDRYMRAAVDAYGRVDLHFLNAGIFGGFTALPDLEVAEFDRVMAVNLRGQFLGLRAAFRDYRRRRAGGAVVLTASIASFTGSADLLAYQTSKHATLGLLHGAAMYGAPIGVRVNAVAPGIVPTELFASAATATGGKDDMAVRASTTPLRRAGSPEEIAAVVAFLLSSDASYLAGEVIRADGGAGVVNTVRPSGGAGRWDPREVDEAMYGTADERINRR